MNVYADIKEFKLQKKIADQIDDWVMWSSLLVYLAVWVLIPFTFESTTHWYVGTILGIVYVLGHVYEIKYRGHCYMSADATAVPNTFIVAILLYIVLRVLDIPQEGLLKSFLVFPVAFTVGHVAALLYAFILGGVLSIIFVGKD